MAIDRYRYDRNRYRDWETSDRDRRDREEASYGRGWRDEDGYIARRGFGNRSSGYDRDRDYEDRYYLDRERDFGDSAGYGTGGSARDWRDVMGEDRRRGGTGFGVDYNRGWDRGSYGSAYDRDLERYGSGFFGRGSRDYNEDRGFLERAGDEIRSWFGDEDADRRRDMDVRRAEQHKGRGPRGYKRSDERILEDVNDRLTDDPHLDASEIEVSVSDREVTLTGTVHSRFEKRHAEDLAESVSGVTHVQNNLRVQQYADAGMGGSMMSGRETGSQAAGDKTATGSAVPSTPRRQTTGT